MLKLLCVIFIIELVNSNTFERQLPFFLALISHYWYCNVINYAVCIRVTSN